MQMNSYYQEALVLYARREGRNWKAHLHQDWMRNHVDYPDISSRLIHLRNMASFGPSGLVKFRLPKGN